MFREYELAHSFRMMMKKCTQLVFLFGFVLGSFSAFADSPLSPKRHFKIKNPAQLTAAEAMSIYDNISEQMFKGYRLSDIVAAKAFGKWRRYNSVPYNSATHGNRYVNNYANPLAKRYGNLKTGEILPKGAVIAKDSFTVTSDRSVFAGALFVMEKLAPGESPQTGDWRYQMIMPDGSLFGDTKGAGSNEVAFCHGCHAVQKEQDFLYFIPEPFRRQFLE